MKHFRRISEGLWLRFATKQKISDSGTLLKGFQHYTYVTLDDPQVFRTSDYYKKIHLHMPKAFSFKNRAVIVVKLNKKMLPGLKVIVRRISYKGIYEVKEVQGTTMVKLCNNKTYDASKLRRAEPDEIRENKRKYV